MISINHIPDDEPLLEISPLIRGVLKTAVHRRNGGIGLTKSGGFNRKFVRWAAASFDWSGCSEEELFQLNKVLDEIDFPPVGDIHALLAELRLGRRRKGMFLLTKAGRELAAHPGRLLSELVPNYLFRLDHGVHLRSGGDLLGNWDVFLNVINVEADHGASLGMLRAALYGAPDTEAHPYDEIGWTFYITVLRPLCWAGLLQTGHLGRMSMDAQFFKTALWRRYLRLDTDRLLEHRRLH